MKSGSCYRVVRISSIAEPNLILSVCGFFLDGLQKGKKKDSALRAATLWGWSAKDRIFGDVHRDVGVATIGRVGRETLYFFLLR